MNKIHLANIDLNLLTVFDAVMLERNTTRAALRVGLTQPAVSHALGRLRVLFGDALFVRSPHGMVPTPLAEEMAPRVRHMLEQIEGLLAREKGFTPRVSSRRFVVGLSDYAALVLLPPVMGALAAEAPAVSLVVKNTAHGTGLAMLDDGNVQLAAGNFPMPPAHMREELLYRERFVCAMRKGHPVLSGKLTLKRYLGCEHLQVSTAGTPYGCVDAALAGGTAGRLVKVTVAHFLAAPLLLEETDLIATEPERLFAPFIGRLRLALAKPPFAVPDFSVTQLWHSRYDDDPGHVWLRSVFRRAAEARGTHAARRMEK